MGKWWGFKIVQVVLKNFSNTYPIYLSNYLSIYLSIYLVEDIYRQELETATLETGARPKGILKKSVELENALQVDQISE